MTNLATTLRDALRAAPGRGFGDTPIGVLLHPRTKGDRAPMLQSLTYGAPVAEADFRGMLGTLRDAMEVARVVRFEGCPIEHDAYGNPTPEPATAGEVEHFLRGLVPVPSSPTFLETVVGDDGIGLLVRGTVGDGEPTMTVRRVDHYPVANAIAVTPICAMVRVGPRFEVSFADPLGCLDAYAAAQVRNLDLPEGDDEAVAAAMGRDARLAIRLLATLGSPSTEVEDVEPSSFATRRRRDKGLAPEMPHRVARIAGTAAPTGDAGEAPTDHVAS